MIQFIGYTLEIASSATVAILATAWVAMLLIASIRVVQRIMEAQ